MPVSGTPGWTSILDFLQSEIAIRKSNRDEPAYQALKTIEKSGNKNNDNNNTHSENYGQHTKIDFSRIKIIIAFHENVASAGSRPLVPPYRLLVIWPPTPPRGRQVYEFLTFNEFYLDLRKMLIDRIQDWSLWLAVIAFMLSLPIETMRRIVSRNIDVAGVSARRKHSPLAPD